MLPYGLKRLLYITPVLFGVSIVCFLLVHLAPGDVLPAILPTDATQDLIEQMRAAYGLDKPLPVQYALWLWKVLHGDLGNSIATGRAVATEVMRAVGNTLILAAVATLIGFTFGAFFGFVAGYFRQSPLDRLASTLSVLGLSVPHYWLGMMLAPSSGDLAHAAWFFPDHRQKIFRTLPITGNKYFVLYLTGSLVAASGVW
jgi:peptide/nickel transport system permease protein